MTVTPMLNILINYIHACTMYVYHWDISVWIVIGSLVISHCVNTSKIFKASDQVVEQELVSKGTILPPDNRIFDKPSL